MDVARRLGVAVREKAQFEYERVVPLTAKGPVCIGRARKVGLRDIVDGGRPTAMRTKR